MTESQRTAYLEALQTSLDSRDDGSQYVYEARRPANENDGQAPSA